MLEIKFFRESPSVVRASEERRGHDLSFVEDTIKYDELWRTIVQKLETLKHQRNVVSEEINSLKKKGLDATEKIKSMRKVVEDIADFEKQAEDALFKRDAARKNVGNILDKLVPVGKDDSENVPIKYVGKKPVFKFKLRDHIEIGKICDLIEFDAARMAAGAGFFYLKNEAAVLDLALQKYAVDSLVKKGFNMYWVPMMLNRATLSGGVNVSEFVDTIYKIEGEDLYLIGTSEHPLVALHKDEILAEDQLPLKLGGISSCFRKEGGAHGKDDKGIFRVHQFNKIEQVMYCKPEDGAKYFKEMMKNAEELFKGLEIPFRVVRICTGDLGNKQALQYDIEGWMPGQAEGTGRYRELGSCSNCLSYQAETLGTKYINKKGEKEYVHMLNNTAIAIPRAIIAILENFQQEDGSVKIPKALWKYAGFKVIKAKK